MIFWHLSNTFNVISQHNNKYHFCTGNTYYNSSAIQSSVEQDDQCYHNINENERRPETALSVVKLPDVVLQSEFRETLDEQFKVSGN